MKKYIVHLCYGDEGFSELVMQSNVFADVTMAARGWLSQSIADRVEVYDEDSFLLIAYIR